MKLDFDAEELDRLADTLALKVAEKLKPLLRLPKDQDNILTVETLAQYLAVEKDWVYSHVREIPHFKVGRFPRFKKAEIDRWLEAQKAPHCPTPAKRPYSLYNTPSKIAQPTGETT